MCTGRAARRHRLGVGPGDVAPDFALTNFNGKPMRLADYRGKLVLLNFWASSCGPCLEEMPRLPALQRKSGAVALQVNRSLDR